MRSRASLISLATVLAALALPVVAEAATRYVATSGSDFDPDTSGQNNCLSAASPCRTIGHTVGQAETDDTIQIAAGTYNESVSTDKRLHFVGAGAGSLDAPSGTVIAAPGGTTALTLQAGGSVRSLCAKGGEHGEGILLDPSTNGSFSYRVAEAIGIGGPVSGSSAPRDGLRARGDAARSVSLTVTGGAFQGGSGGSHGDGSGLAVGGPATSAELDGVTLRSTRHSGLASSAANVTLSRSVAEGRIGAFVGSGTLEVRRSRLKGSLTGPPLINVANGLLVSSSAAATVTDSLVSASSNDAAVEVEAALASSGPGGMGASLTARGTTFVASGADPDAAVAAVRSEDSAPLATVDLHNSIARLEGPVEAGEGDLVADNTDGANAATVIAGFSSFNTRAEVNGGTATPPGAETNVSGDPRFQNPPAGDYSLAPSSPLIDRGDPAIVASGQLDLAGAPRSQDGNGDCQALPDMGAFERPDSCPGPQQPQSGSQQPQSTNVPPVVSGFGLTNRVFAPVRRARHSAAARKRVARGTRFRYSLSEAARVSITIERALPGRRVRLGGRTRCLRPSRRNRRARRCTRHQRVGTLRANGVAGPNRTFFTGRFRRRALARGCYRATIVAIDAQGARSRPRRASFRVIRR